MDLVSYFRDLVRPLLSGQKVIFAGAPLAASPQAIRAYRDLGVADIFIVANGIGTGDLPAEDEATWVVLDVEAATLMEEMRHTRVALENLPASARHALDSWDPEHDAVLLGNPFYTRPVFAGRRVYGNRRPEWEALEDKVIVDAIWDGAGVRRAPAEVVPAESWQLQAAAERLDRGMGTAWAGDAREGFNGGAEYVRWIRQSEDCEEASEFFASHCDRVRVMPFLEGIPCSIHGMVFPDTVLAMRPCEMITLRPPVGNRLRYGGAATFWDPPDDDRRAMREVARLVGRHLAELVRFRGGFTVDGVLTVEGFRPTELNTRLGAGTRGVFAGLGDLPMGMIQRALVEGEPLDYRPRELEDLIVESADRSRGGGALAVVPESVEETVTEYVQYSDSAYRATDDLEAADAKLLYGPSAVGGFVQFLPEPGKTPAGPSLGPRAVAALSLADEIWNTGIGPLSPAVPVR